MIQKFLSSGDLIADRRADYARLLGEVQDFASAADVMRQALDLAPGWAAGWFTLGTYAEKAADPEAASEAYRHVLRLMESDIFGAGLKLAILGRANVPPAPPSAFVERLFDGYARRFDHSLVERLGYSVPERLIGMITDLRGPNCTFAHAVDLGCGTGLMGERVRARASFMEGYDLSTGMLTQAREKSIYDHLAVYDLALAPGQLPISGYRKADLVTATDVFIYLGDLGTAFSTVAAILRPGGIFAFSIERGLQETDWLLQPSLRYCHGEAYIRRLSEQHAFTVKAAISAPIRRDGTETISGMMFVLEKTSEPAATIADPLLAVTSISDETLMTH